MSPCQLNGNKCDLLLFTCRYRHDLWWFFSFSHSDFYCKIIVKHTWINSAREPRLDTIRKMWSCKSRHVVIAQRVLVQAVPLQMNATGTAQLHYDVWLLHMWLCCLGVKIKGGGYPKSTLRGSVKSHISWITVAYWFNDNNDWYLSCLSL